MLNVPTFSQNDPQWGKFKLGNGTGTIGDFGCLLTAFTSLLKFYKKDDWINPDRINALMISYNGYSGRTKNLWEWYIAEKFGVVYFGSASFDDLDVKRHLKRDIPIIVRVDGKPIGGTEHFVLAIGDSKIMDPWDGKIKPFSTYTPLGYHVYVNVKDEVTKPIDNLSDFVDSVNNFLTKMNVKNLDEALAVYNEQVKNLQTEREEKRVFLDNISPLLEKRANNLFDAFGLISGWTIGMVMAKNEYKRQLEESQKQLELCINDRKILENKPKPVEKTPIDQPKPVRVVLSTQDNGLITKIIKFLESLRK